MSTLILHAGEPVPNLRNFEGEIEFTDELLHLHSSARTVTLTLLDNALRRGAFVPKLQFSCKGKPVWELIAAQLNDLSPRSLREYVLEIERRHPLVGQWDVLEGNDGQRVFRTHIPGSQVFHERFVNRIPRLKAVPERWTLMHVKQALANGQFKDLRCDSQYSDDYARDVLNDYYAGALEASAFLARLVSAGSDSGISAGQCGWETSLNAGTMKVMVNQHSFDNNSFTLVL